MLDVSFFPKFKQLTTKDLFVDFHLHSTWTDGKNSIQEIKKKAQENDLHSIAITDHIRKTSTYFLDYYKEIQEINNQDNTFNIYTGFEAKINSFNGDIDIDQETTNTADIAIASVHRFPLGNKLYNGSEFKESIAQEIELELNLAALKEGGFNVLGHPGGMSLVFFKSFPKEFFEEIIKQCAANNIAFDLNGRYHKNSLEMLLPLLEKYNPHVSIGTDAHNIEYMIEWNYLLKERLLCQT